MPYQDWKDKNYQEVRGSDYTMHPDIPCKEKRPFYLDIIENSKYYACDGCKSAWVDKVIYQKERYVKNLENNKRG